MPFETFGNDVFAHHGRQLIGRFLDDQPQASPTDPLPRPQSTIAAKNAASASPSTSLQVPLPANPVGILGAGASGLYTALILDDLGIPYKILEARNRVGGRLYTHRFPNSTGAPYNYFDVGAMRFPEIPAMRRVFQLFDYPPLNTSSIALKEKLKPFYFRGAANNDTLLSYNGVTVKQNAVPTVDAFHGDALIQGVPEAQRYLDVGVKAIVDDVIEPFTTPLLADLANGTSTGWKRMREFDQYSTRAYMSIAYRPSPKLQSRLPNAPLPTDVVNWIETFDTSTGSYDCALSETILDAVAFGSAPSANPSESTKWWCIEGGAYQIADCMEKYIRSRNYNAISFNRQVTSIGVSTDPKGSSVMEVVTDGQDRQQFCHVISSIPLPVMRTIDLDNAGLTVVQSNALRQLNYSPSIKIGMQFRKAWWTTGMDKDGNPMNIIGGQTYTDSPLRTVVYPSFGNVKDGQTTTLIASYCWTEDAERLGTLIGNGNKILEDLVLRELATIHNVTVEFLRGLLIDTFGWDWSRDPYTMGAYAFFGPGKFGTAYQSLNTPAGGGRLHFAGEAISVRHAWVEGALDSAWRAVYELVTLDPAFMRFQRTFFENWGVNAEWFEKKTLPKDAPPPSLPTLSRGTIISPPLAKRPAEPQRVDLGNLLEGSLLYKTIAATHPELV